MARPMRKDADYFPFICKEGKTFSILRSRYPLEGVGFFTELCIILTTTPDHHVQLKDDIDFEYFVSRINCTKEKAEEIIELLVLTKKIHPILWKKAKVIVIPDLLDSLTDAYERRNNDIITIEDMVNVYVNDLNDDINKDSVQQKHTKDSKVKESKPKDSKVFIQPTIEQITEYCKKRNNKVNPEKFFDSCESKGWMIGKTKMKNWEAAVRTWEHNNFNNNASTKKVTESSKESLDALQQMQDNSDELLRGER